MRRRRRGLGATVVVVVVGRGRCGGWEEDRRNGRTNDAVLRCRLVGLDGVRNFAGREVVVMKKVEARWLGGLAGMSRKWLRLRGTSCATSEQNEDQIISLTALASTGMPRLHLLRLADACVRFDDDDIFTFVFMVAFLVSTGASPAARRKNKVFWQGKPYRCTLFPRSGKEKVMTDVCPWCFPT